MRDQDDHPNSTELQALATTARHQFLDGQREAARASIDRAVQLAPASAEISAIRAILYLDESERGMRTSPELDLFDAAMASAAKAAELDPSWPMAHTIIGRLHLANGDRDAAARSAATAIELDRDHAETEILLGDLRRAAGDRAGATAHYSQATPAPMAVDRLRSIESGGSQLWAPCLIALGAGVVLRMAGAVTLGALASLLGLAIAVVILVQSARRSTQRSAAKQRDTTHLLADDGQLATRMTPPRAP